MVIYSSHLHLNHSSLSSLEMGARWFSESVGFRQWGWAISRTT